MGISAWLTGLIRILPELVAGLTLVAASLSTVFGYLNYRSQDYTSIDARQVELSKALDGNTITYAYSRNQEVRENRDRFIDSLVMHVRTPRIFDRSILRERETEELKEKYLPTYRNSRYTRIQVEFDADTERFPDLYDLCIFSKFIPAPYTGDFTSIVPGGGNSNISVINRIGPQHFEIEVVSERPTDVQSSLDLVYGAVTTAIVRRALLERGELHYMTEQSLESNLEEMIEDFENADPEEMPLVTGPAIPEEVLDEFRNKQALF
ncbi:hypothetical protein SAMN05216388_103828 [Halorientalis persicus]|uniref:Uncharacterized protein n=1 Tax=Halorientalis persicus TaxID=1367881 RepID=A0A1H8VJB9_9EURY|nr:hypothetical protein [Halorientalis persicus]SEP15515.1 hypothetical protein SAMN05216388_103828 [Halorientalis persicus]